MELGINAGVPPTPMLDPEKLNRCPQVQS